MPEGIIVFSAQFGGRDAAQKVLPHFKSLQTASAGIVLQSFPFEKLGFILRVDGNISRFDYGELSNIDVHGTEYISLDIAVPADVICQGDDVISAHISRVLGAVPAFLVTHPEKGTEGLDFSTIDKVVIQVVQNYSKAQLAVAKQLAVQ